MNIQVYLNVNGLDTTSICTLYEHSIMSLRHFHLHPIPPQPKITTPSILKKIIEHHVIQFLYTCIYQRERVFNDDTILFVPVSLREQYQYLQRKLC